MNSDKKPRVIKRYQNRKLYDTQNSCYVTLDDIGNFIKNGEDVVIIDNKTQEDLTTVTLTQIIFEQEKKKKNLLPLNALKKIIQSGGEQIVEFLQKSIQSVSSISNVKDEAERVIDKIRDEIEDGGSFVKDFLSKAHQGMDEFTKKFEEKFKSIGRITNLPFLRTEIRSLRKKVAELERKLRQFEK
jgi:polyhydroxyalkanoate synthesis repressor PhaR